MTTFIALLRGINVAGQKSVKMEKLREILAELPFENIKTYIQSGNIIFKSNEENIRILEQQITDVIKKHFGFQVPVIIVTPNALKLTVDKNPFSEKTLLDAVQPYVAFLSDEPDIENIAVLKQIDFGKDEFEVIDKSVYLFYGNSAGNTKLTNIVLENKLKVKATSRNWKTIHKLIELTEND